MVIRLQCNRFHTRHVYVSLCDTFRQTDMKGSYDKAPAFAINFSTLRLANTSSHHTYPRQICSFPPHCGFRVLLCKTDMQIKHFCLLIIIIIIKPLSQFGQEPQPSLATGMALVLCILGTFLEVVCHCFPPRLDVPTSSGRCLHVRQYARDPSSERWNYGREMSGIFPSVTLTSTLHLGIIYMPQIYDINLEYA
jgi:hypothetical protein